MNIDTNTIFSMTEANQNFSMVTRAVDQYGTAIIFKNNKPRYEVRVEDVAQDETAADKDVLEISNRLLQRNAAVYEELAK
ncbi:MAG: type II toxin-antitoxin system Phd/YefM family antitoxin [Ruminococcus sp.]